MAVKLKPLSRQTIVVTGGTSGIGLTTAREAAARGADVVLVARNEDSLRQVCEDIRGQGGRADYVVGDVGSREDMRRVVDTVVARHGGFDTWVNDAGVGVYATLEEISDQDHDRIFQTNYWGVVYGSLEALKHLKQRGGAIVNIGSIASEMATPVLSAYAASKHAVKGFTDSLRMELIHDKAPVSVTLIKPSGIQTPFGDHARNYMEEASQVPPPVYAPELVAKAVLRAAETPIREITIGGAGKLMTVFAALAPNLSDRMYAWSFFKLARDPSRPKRNTAALHKPGRGGRTRGEQGGYVRETSLYTTARLHPWMTLVLGLAAAGAAGLVFTRAGRRAAARLPGSGWRYAAAGPRRLGW